MLYTIVVVLLILFLIGALPTWNHSRDWGGTPSGSIGVILIVVIILWLLGVFPKG